MTDTDGSVVDTVLAVLALSLAAFILFVIWEAGTGRLPSQEPRVTAGSTSEPVIAHIEETP